MGRGAIFAPIINGNELVSVTRPDATSGTINEVVIELDCTPAVTKVPQPNDLYGLLKTYFFSLSFDAPISLV